MSSWRDYLSHPDPEHWSHVLGVHQNFPEWRLRLNTQQLLTSLQGLPEAEHAAARGRIIRAVQQRLQLAPPPAPVLPAAACPFCQVVPCLDFEAEPQLHLYQHAGGLAYRLLCQEPSCPVRPETAPHKTPDQAIKAWNRPYVMKDKDIRVHLRPWLKQRHATPGVLIKEEWGQLWNTRPDVAIFENHSFHAYEIKSDHDSLTRLAKQLEGYGEFFHKITVVTGNVYAQKVADMVPDWVGLLVVAPAGGGQAHLNELRVARPSPLRRSPEIALWVKELQQLLRDNGITGAAKLRQDVALAMVRRLGLPERELLPFIVSALTKRYR